MKYADDTVILGLIVNDNITEYMNCIKFVNTWCNENYLNLNVSKTKEIIWDFRRHKADFIRMNINDMEVDVVHSYKYLGLVIDDKLSFSDHVDNQIKKANKRMYCVRSMRNLNVSTDIICRFFNATIPSVLMYAGVGYYCMITKHLKSKLNKPLKVCNKLLRTSHPALISNDINFKAGVCRLAGKIRQDICHPLHKEYKMLPSGRRLRVMYARTNRFRNTFIPTSITMLNDNML